MGVGVVFMLLLIAATIAPLVWAIWWVAASVGSTRPGFAKAVVEPVRKARLYFSFPQPADMSLPRYPRAIAICRLSDGAEIESCSGPDLAGKCPRAAADGSVPCAGSMLSLPRLVRGSAEWHIPAGYKACLVGSYQVFRQPVS
ncbi:MAG TPA: hypothetical protein VN965_08900 [Candidatus Dormibacteraeota bacterium]|nr:hypothetical protein [Candidatus Dormibacteraeota bacterium]